MGRCGSLDSLHDVTPSERPASHFSDEGNIIYLELTILKRKIQLCTERYFSGNTEVSFKSETKKYSSLTNTWQWRKSFNLSLNCINIFSCKLSLLVLTKNLWNVPNLFDKLLNNLFYPNTFLEASWKGWSSIRQDCSICSYLYFQSYLRLILSYFLFFH